MVNKTNKSFIKLHQNSAKLTSKPNVRNKCLFDDRLR